MAERVGFSLALPEGWYELGAAADAAARASADTDADADPAPSRLAAELARAVAQAARQNRPGRVRYVYVGGSVPTVQAWAHLELAARDGATPEGLLARLQSDAAGSAAARAAGATTVGAATAGDASVDATAATEVRPWRRESGAALLAGLPAVVVDDLLEVPSSVGPRLHRRILVTLFPDADAAGTAETAGAVVQFQLSTPDLTAFDDALTVALGLVESLRFTTESETA
jgi:hypothetical protein